MRKFTMVSSSQNNCGCTYLSSNALFNGIVLGQNEAYDAEKVPVWRFCKSTDVRDGIKLNLGNMCGGYSFDMYGHRFFTSESAYLCGEFSQGSKEAGTVQRALLLETNGWDAKKEIKKPHVQLIRGDWGDFMLQWMLLVVWCKCKGNKRFAKKLMSIPEEEVIVEDSTFQTGPTSKVWGCKNKALRKAYLELKRHLEEEGLSPTEAKEKAGKQMICFDRGIWEGQNNMGKVLKMCQLALLHGVEPPICYDKLREHGIYWFGRELTFQEAA